MEVQVVISRYNEDVSWLSKIIHPVIIYDKSESPIKNSISRKNVGREAENIAYHIVNNYNNLATNTIFLQADPIGTLKHYEMDGIIWNINNHQINNGVLCFCSTEDRNYIIKNNWCENAIKLQPKLFKNIPKYTKICVGAQYSVPKHIIQNRSLNFYKKILNMLQTGKTDAWAMEATWWEIFDLNRKTII